MKFGYFTLSDNHYVGNTRSANDYIRAIAAEAIHAERVGMHSVWIGEHHFSTLGVLSCPDIVLAYVAAVTERVRLAPAVNVLPLHHPIRVAEQWATLDLLSDGRVDFAHRAGLRQARIRSPQRALRGQHGGLRRRARRRSIACGPRTEPVTHKGRFYDFENISITPKPVQTPAADLWSRASRARPSNWPPGWATTSSSRPSPRRCSSAASPRWPISTMKPCAKAGNPPGRMICSYFAHFADGPEEDLAARTSQVRYFQECCIHALPQDIKTAPPTYHYFVDNGEEHEGDDALEPDRQVDPGRRRIRDRRNPPEGRGGGVRPR